MVSEKGGGGGVEISEAKRDEAKRGGGGCAIKVMTGF